MLAVQRGPTVLTYGYDLKELFKISIGHEARLHSFTEHSVCIENKGFITVYGEKGSQIAHYSSQSGKISKY